MSQTNLRKYISVTCILAVLLAFGVANLVAAHDDDRITPVLKDGPVTPSDPDKGLSDDEIRIKDRQMIERQREKNEAFVEEWVASGNEARSLPRYHMLASADSMPNSLAEAVAKAEIVARVRVSATNFQGESATVNVEVQELIKGQIGETMTITQVGGPRLDEPSGKVILAEAEWDPILLPGDDAVLFLVPDPMNAGSYTTVAAQNYRIENGVVRIPEASALPELAGASADDFLATVRAAAG